MRSIFITILSLLLTSGSLAESPDPLCVFDPAQMPASWQPSAELQKSISPEPWSKSEATDAKSAINSGLDEMIGYFKQNPSSVQNLWGDSIEALIQVTYSSTNKPVFDTKARDAARDNLTGLIKTYLDLDPTWAICDEFEHLLPLAIFAHKFYPANDTRTVVVTKRANAAYRACGSLEEAIGEELQEVLTDNNTQPEGLDDLFDLYVWSLWLIEAELYPDIKLPVEARKFGPEVWKYFENLKLHGASTFDDGAKDDEFIKIADLATRITHIPTGIGRFPIYVEDNPKLYRFLRENFYPVLQSGELDLTASFVDSLRQYGCTAENDLQVRDASRYLLKVFHDSKDRWMGYRPAGETNADLDDFDLIHHPWKAILGLRARQIEQPKPGTYGGIVRSWLPHPR